MGNSVTRIVKDYETFCTNKPPCHTEWFRERCNSFGSQLCMNKLFARQTNPVMWRDSQDPNKNCFDVCVDGKLKSGTRKKCYEECIKKQQERQKRLNALSFPVETQEQKAAKIKEEKEKLGRELEARIKHNKEQFQKAVAVDFKKKTKRKVRKSKRKVRKSKRKSNRKSRKSR